jgi:hypothetical protein
MLDYSDIRSKPVILILATTNMRIGAQAELKIRHHKKLPEFDLYHITVYETQRQALFFLYT